MEVMVKTKPREDIKKYLVGCAAHCRLDHTQQRPGSVVPGKIISYDCEEDLFTVKINAGIDFRTLSPENVEPITRAIDELTVDDIEFIISSVKFRGRSLSVKAGYQVKRRFNNSIFIYSYLENGAKIRIRLNKSGYIILTFGDDRRDLYVDNHMDILMSLLSRGIDLQK